MNLRARKRVLPPSRNPFGVFLLIWLLAAICCRAQGVSYDLLVSRAQAALRENKPDQAILLCQTAIQAAPGRWEAYFAAGNVYSAEQRYDDATDMLQKALLRAPEEKRQPIRVALARNRYWSQFSENGQSHAGSDPTLAQQGVATMGTVPRASATNRPAAPSPTQAEVVLWKTIEKSEHIEDFQAYLRAYPNGAFASLADERVKALQPTASVGTSAQSPAKNGQIIGAIVSQGGVRPLANEIHISPSYDSLISQARAALNQKRAKESVAFSEQAIRLDDKRWEAYVIAASGLSAQQLYDDAIGMLQMALPRAPEEKKQLIRGAVADTRKLLATSAAPMAAPSAKSSPANPPVAAAPSQAEVVLWKTIENSEKLEDYRAYLSRYPNGAFAELAGARMERLQNLSPEELHARKVKQLVNTHWIGSRQWEKKGGKVWSIGKFQLTFTDETKCNSDDGGDFRPCTWSLSGDEVHVSMVGTKDLCPVEMDGKFDGDKLTGAFLQPGRWGWNACDKRQGEWELTRSAEGSR